MKKEQPRDILNRNADALVYVDEKYLIFEKDKLNTGIAGSTLAIDLIMKMIPHLRMEIKDFTLPFDKELVFEKIRRRLEKTETEVKHGL